MFLLQYTVCVALIAVFLATALVTVLDVCEIRALRDKTRRKWLFGVLIGQVILAGVGTFGGWMSFDRFVTINEGEVRRRSDEAKSQQALADHRSYVDDHLADINRQIAELKSTTDGLTKAVTVEEIRRIQRDSGGVYVVRTARVDNSTLLKQMESEGIIVKREIGAFPLTVVHSAVGGSGVGIQTPPIATSYARWSSGDLKLPADVRTDDIVGFSTSNNYNIADVKLIEQKGHFEMEVVPIHPHARYVSGQTTNERVEWSLYAYVISAKPKT